MNLHPAFLLLCKSGIGDRFTELRLVNGTRFPIIFISYCHKPGLVCLPYPIAAHAPEVALRYEERRSCKLQATCKLAPSPRDTLFGQPARKLFGQPSVTWTSHVLPFPPPIFGVDNDT